MINNALDIEPYRRELAARGRVQVADILQPDAADALQRCLATEVPWQLAERSQGTPRTSARGAYPDDAAFAGILQQAYARARDDYQFAYDSYMLVRASKEGWDPGLLVHAALRFFNTPEFISFARYLSGDGGITHANAQCTRYRPGQFLMPHEDEDVQEGRRYAYVLNLTRAWRPEWGGQLQFLDGDGAVLDTLSPRWNTLSLFRVPQRHQVTLVAPWAGEPRHAITGWWLGAG